MDVDSINAVDASIMSAVDMMQSCTLGESGSNTLESKKAQDVDMDVDTPVNETMQADEMNIDSPQHALVKSEVRPSPPSKTSKQPTLTTPQHHHAHHKTSPSPTTALNRNTLRTSACAPKPQHKRLKRLAGVDAKSKAPSTISSSKVVRFGGAAQRGSTNPLQRHLRNLRSPQTQSRFAKAVLEAIQEEA